jgi:hypothetical protein
MRVRLETEQGELVTDNVTFPLPFQKLPSLAVWGARIFALQPVGLSSDDGPVPICRPPFVVLSDPPRKVKR